MADTFTTNYNLTKPEIGASPDTWGNKLNANLDAIDAALFAAATDATNALAAANAALPRAGGVMSGDIQFSADISLRADTIDGADTRRLILAAGGGGAITRGAFARLNGNEHATTPGEALLAAGQGARARVRSSRETTGTDGEIALETEQAVVEQTSPGTYTYARFALRHSAVIRGGISADTSGDVEVYGSGGSARLRPNGVGNSTGEFEVDALGNAVATAGMFDVTGNVRRVPINTQNGNYTFALTDLGKVVRKDGASAIAYTINPEGTTAYGDGFIVTVRNANAAGNITLTRGSGVVLREANSSVDANIVISPWGVKTLVREASNVWVAL